MKGRLYHRDKRRLDNNTVRKRRQNGFVAMQEEMISSYLGSHVPRPRGVFGKGRKH